MATETATFGMGCFWCTEAVFKDLKGVVSVLPGYSGGEEPNPTYEAVCDGTTGHAEVAQIEFDPEVISFSQLLDVFWAVHDPTTKDRQGNDVGTQYRSEIFYHSDQQKAVAEESKQKIEEAAVYDDPIVTEITEFKEFFVAEDYHKNYYENNPGNPYCSVVITPKVKKLREKFAHLLKSNDA